MNEKDWVLILNGVTADLKASMPKVTGNLVRNIRAYNSYGKGDVLGRISIEVPYATFVNYGYENHQKSEKLKRDYKLVEKTIKNSINARMAIFKGEAK